MVGTKILLSIVIASVWICLIECILQTNSANVSLNSIATALASALLFGSVIGMLMLGVFKSATFNNSIRVLTVDVFSKTLTAPRLVLVLTLLLFLTPLGAAGPDKPTKITTINRVDDPVDTGILGFG